MTTAAVRQGVPTSMAFVFALRELRGGLRGFRLLLACLFLGVAAIAVVGSLSAAVEQGLKNDGRRLLGGDLALQFVHQPATEEQINWLSGRARLTRVREMTAMARTPEQGGKRSMIELRGVESSYPLIGQVELLGTEGQKEALTLTEALAFRAGEWGVIVPQNLLNKLGRAVGDSILIGETRYRIRARLIKQPDLNSRAFAFASSVIVADESLENSGLIQPGSLIRYDYRLLLNGNNTIESFKRALEARFPDAGWRLRETGGAAAGVTRFIAIIGDYLTLAGLATLLVGGVGIASGVKNHLDRKVATLATLKCLGANSGFIVKTCLIQILGLSFLGIAAGVVVGAATPAMGAALTQNLFNWSLASDIFVWPLVIAAGAGVLTVLIFSLHATACAGHIRPARLFRDVSAPLTGRPSKKILLCIVFCALALMAVSLVLVRDLRIAGGALVGVLALFVLYRLAGYLVTRLAQRRVKVANPAIRTALSNPGRPGAPTTTVLVSVGTGLSVLVLMALLDSNVRHALNQSLPEEAPGFYFIDIQPAQVSEFERIVTTMEGVESLQRVPMLRGRITAINNRAPESFDIPEDIAWIFRSDRGLTWSAEMPAGTEMTKGDWWPPDYDGPPLLSLDERVMQGLGLEIGDSLSLNILGRQVTATIANSRRIDWRGLQINFVMIFSPGLLSQAPQTHIATVKTRPGIEDELEIILTDRFSNISSVRVKEALGAFSEVFNHISLVLRAMSSLTVIVGVFVLGGAIAASNQQRVYDAVVLKVLGASRKSLALVFLVEFGLLGLIAALLATATGTIAAWVITTTLFKLDFILNASVVILVPLVGLACALAFGYIGTWAALKQRPIALLRNR